jgi:hypothetical protein
MYGVDMMLLILFGVGKFLGESGPQPHLCTRLNRGQHLSSFIILLQIQIFPFFFPFFPLTSTMVKEFVFSLSENLYSSTNFTKHQIPLFLADHSLSSTLSLCLNRRSPSPPLFLFVSVSVFLKTTSQWQRESSKARTRSAFGAPKRGPTKIYLFLPLLLFPLWGVWAHG